MRNRAGIIQRFPMGTDEVEYSNVKKTESRMGCGLGRDGHRPGDIPASSPGGVWDKDEFYRAIFLKTDPAGIEPASLGSKPKRISSTPWILLISYISKDIKYFLPII